MNQHPPNKNQPSVEFPFTTYWNVAPRMKFGDSVLGQITLQAGFISQGKLMAKNRCNVGQRFVDQNHFKDPNINSRGFRYSTWLSNRMFGLIPIHFGFLPLFWYMSLEFSRSDRIQQISLCVFILQVNCTIGTAAGGVWMSPDGVLEKRSWM